MRGRLPEEPLPHPELEKFLSDNCRDERVHGKIVPFEHVADDSSGNCTPTLISPSDYHLLASPIAMDLWILRVPFVSHCDI
jgi:hypothetical protein